MTRRFTRFFPLYFSIDLLTSVSATTELITSLAIKRWCKPFPKFCSWMMFLTSCFVIITVKQQKQGTWPRQFSAKNAVYFTTFIAKLYLISFVAKTRTHRITIKPSFPLFQEAYCQCFTLFYCFNRLISNVSNSKLSLSGSRG